MTAPADVSAAERGATAEWRKFLALTPGVDVLANVANMALTGQVIRRVPGWVNFVYLLALGSPSHPIEDEAWSRWTAGYDKHWGAVYDQTYLGFAPLFGHQYSHVWVDFRGIRDAYMREHESWSVYLGEHGRGDDPPRWLRRWRGDGVIARIEASGTIRERSTVGRFS